MLKSLALTCSLVGLALSLSPSAYAQGQGGFPDTPENHWAYKAVAELKQEGILVGYPDGLFRGTRPVSRYEMAVALYAAYKRLQDLIGGLDSTVKGIATVNPQDLDDLRNKIASLHNDINALKGFGDDIANLQRASDTFEKELEQLGVNVEAMKHDLGQLGDRVTKLEKKKQPVDIHGDIDFWVGMGNSVDNYYGLNKDGRLEGTSYPGSISNVFPNVPYAAGLLQDETFLHEAAFSINGTNDKGPTWKGTIVVSDMFGNFGANVPGVAFGNQSDVFNPGYGSANVPVSGLFGYSVGQEDVYVQDLSVKMGSDRANVEAGRVAYSIDPYMYQRLANSSYYVNDRWDNGLYYFDGAIAGFKLGPSRIDVFGGRNSGLYSAQGVDLDPVRTGPIDGPFSGGPNLASGSRMDIDRSLGVNVNTAIGKAANIDLAYLALYGDSSTPIDLGENIDRLSVYGGNASLKLGPVDLTGGYHKSDVEENSAGINSTDNSAWNVRLGTTQKKFDVFGEYREVQANYLAPGDWGRLGVLRNPTNIKGARFGASVKLAQNWKLSGNGEFDSGLSNTFATSTFLGTQTDISAYTVRLDYYLKSNISLYGSYEDDHFGNLAAPSAFDGSGDPNYKWTTIGLGYGFSSNARFDILYELSDVDNDYQATNGANFRGGFLATQLTVKF